MILGVSVVLMIIGLAAVSVARIDTRNVSADNDWSEAQTLALSAAENALARIAATANWRTQLSGLVTVPMGHGTMQWQITDDADGQLADDYTEPILIVASGQVGASRYRLGLRCFVVGQPLAALSRCLCADGDINVDKGSQLTVTGGAASTNNDFHGAKKSSLIVGDLEADGVFWKENVTGNVSEHAPVKAMPNARVVGMYRELATDISGRTLINRQAIGPGRNPWGTANANGVYYLDAPGSDVTLRNSRILGTLVVRCRRLTINNNVLLESYRKDMPALIVDGELVLNYQSTSSQLRESAENTNFNPPGVPYSGATDSDKADSYPSEIRGLVHVRGDLTLDSTALVRGAIVCEGQVQCSGTNQIVHDASLSNQPMIGYSSGDGYLYRAGWKRMTD
jgi:type II secretory pathway pseudopilin PulG